jgi:hypothetical protein
MRLNQLFKLLLVLVLGVTAQVFLGGVFAALNLPVLNFGVILAVWLAKLPYWKTHLLAVVLLGILWEVLGSSVPGAALLALFLIFGLTLGIRRWLRLQPYLWLEAILILVFYGFFEGIILAGQFFEGARIGLIDFIRLVGPGALITALVAFVLSPLYRIFYEVSKEAD